MTISKNVYVLMQQQVRRQQVKQKLLQLSRCGLVFNNNIDNIVLNNNSNDKIIGNRRYFSSSIDHHVQALQRRAQELCGAPATIAYIPDGAQNIRTDINPNPSVVIRPIGCTRRVFLLNPHMSYEEIEGLAYRVRTLTKNTSLNSILIATNDSDDMNTNCLPTYALELESLPQDDEDMKQIFNTSLPPNGCTWHVSSGYNPLEIDSKKIDSLLENIKNLALAIRGGDDISNKAAGSTASDISNSGSNDPDGGHVHDDDAHGYIPVITIPHGMLEDSGILFCLSSYVLCTNQSCLRITYPQKGLSFDPIGLSYILPRLGKEYNQLVSDYLPGKLIALCGYQLDGYDMVETGLATHFMTDSSPDMLGTLENTLANLHPYNQQKYIKKPRTYMSGGGYKNRMQSAASGHHDHYKQFRNVAVANTIHAFTSYRADGTDMWSTDDTVDDNDLCFPSYKDCYPMPWHEDRVSDIVDYSVAFHDILKKPTLIEIYESLKEVSNRVTNDEEEQEGIDIAKSFVAKMNNSSPLALMTMHELMKIGSEPTQTLQMCIEREKRAQSKLYKMEDYLNWSKYAKSQNLQQDSQITKPLPPFQQWKHKSIKDVTQDEVLELIS